MEMRSFAQREYLAIAVALLTLAMPINAAAGQIVECTVVENLAKAGHFDWDDVNAVGDKDSMVCAFSVNGATTDSPPQEEVAKAMRSMIGTRGSPGRLFRDGEFDVDQLAILLLAASPVQDIDAVSEILTGWQSMLSSCRAAIMGNHTVAFSTDDDNTFGCGAYHRGASGELYSFGPIYGTTRTRLSSPRFVVGVRLDSIWHILSVARPY